MKLERLQKFNKESELKRTNYRLQKTNQFNKNKTQIIDDEDEQVQDIEVKYDMLEEEAKELLEMKTSVIQKKCEENLVLEI